MRIGFTEVLLISTLILLLFGSKKLPELAKAIGKSLGEFKKGTKEIFEEVESVKKEFK